MTTDLIGENSKGKEGDEKHHVPPIRHLGVVAHQLRVDVVRLDFDALYAIDEAAPVV